MYSKQKIIHVLKQVHPDTRISGESVAIIQNLFSIFDNLTETETLNLLSGELKKHAISEQTKAIKKGENGLSAIMEYLSAEILELSGNCARDCRKMTITGYHIWLSILGDAELETSFAKMKPHLKIIPHISKEALIEHGRHIRPEKGKLKDQFKDNSIKIDSTIFNPIYYTIIHFGNTCLTDKSLKEKIQSFGEVPEQSSELLLSQLYDIVIDKLIKEMAEHGEKITLTALNQIVLKLFPNEKFN